MNFKFTLSAVAVSLSLTTFAAHGDTLLSPQEAFKVQAKQVSNTEINFTYRIAPGYVLYKDHFEMIMSNGSAKVADVILPPGVRKFDKAMNKDMETYRDQVTVRVKIQPGQGTQGTLIAKAQGCAVEQGVCYPPFNKAWALGPVNIDSVMDSHAGCDSKLNLFSKAC